MKLFACPHCRNRIYFENTVCLNCKNAVLYDPAEREFVLAAHSAGCGNAGECDCNWIAARDGRLCLSCALNKTIPDLSVAGNRRRWTDVERAKKRALYSLLHFAIPVRPKRDGRDEAGIAFDLLAPIADEGPGTVLTGHDHGLITLNVAEADASEREKMRAAMGENYRTLLGHFRHELGHFCWERLIRDRPDRLAAYRQLFGDERRDYAAALAEHYRSGAPADWQEHFISGYAASHPWEDWAETFAHYLHITDTLEMVGSLRLPLDELATATEANPPAAAAAAAMPFQLKLARWLALSEAANSINRCMGLSDLYPFVVSPGAADKLAFVDTLLGEAVPVAR